jgi:hypothetical protein
METVWFRYAAEFIVDVTKRCMVGSMKWKGVVVNTAFVFK